jgi:hypothetical protein
MGCDLEALLPPILFENKIQSPPELGSHWVERLYRLVACGVDLGDFFYPSAKFFCWTTRKDASLQHTITILDF